MIGRTRMLQQSGASLLAIGAATIFMPMDASACTAFAVTRDGAPAVDILCPATEGPAEPEPPAEPFQSSFGTGETTIYGGGGADRLELRGGAIVTDGSAVPVFGTDFQLDPSTGEVNLLAGNDVAVISSGTIGIAGLPLNLNLGAGTDNFTMSGGTIFGSVLGQGGGNTYLMSGGTIDGSIFAGSQDDTVTIEGSATINGNVASVFDAVGLEDGNDRFIMIGGVLNAAVSGGAGNDIIDFRGGVVDSFLEGNEGDDQLFISGGLITSDVYGDDGNDEIAVSGGRIDGSLLAGSGDDRVTISGGANIRGGTGSDGEVSVLVAGPFNAVDLGDGDDRLEMTGGTVAGSVAGGIGNDTIAISGGTIDSFVAGDEDNDAISVSGGFIAGDVRGDDGTDSVTVSGGTIAGGLEAESVTLNGGTILGDISGLGPNTLTINGTNVADPLNLSDGVVFSGTGANAIITDTDLAAGGTKTQVFNGFNLVASDNSTLGFGPGPQDIGTLNLTNGSTLFTEGATTLPGTVNVTNSLIDMRNNVANDILTLGGVSLNNAQIGLDIDQQALTADRLVANNLSAAGTNTVLVNLLGTPEFTEPTEIPIIITGAPVNGTFQVAGVPGSVASLFTYQVIPGPDGGLFLLATPANFGIAAAPNSAVNASIVDTVIDAVYDINSDAIDSDLGLANGARRVQVTPTFGVFASGLFAHTEHDGFSITDGNLGGAGPEFDADDFSAAISLDFNAARHFQLDTQYGLNLGLFVGYASTDVNLGAFQGFAGIGDGENRSAMFGGYALLRKDFNYALVSASAFLGNSDVTSGVLNTTGSYDTEGYAVTGSVGHIFSLSERARFDLRGGLLGVSFTGDSYVDSGGNHFGKSRVSFGAIKFEPGIYADYQMPNGMTLSPYVRTEFQQRFGYRNTTEIDDREIDFDDADFSASLSAGFNLKTNEQWTLSGELRGKASADSSTFGGKLGVKVAF
ncbi:autotransporter [Mesorhizobium sp. 1B3]|uniref:autotransporter n=1 Tax=Mesorhizobium sp. 1B3 TaxID=3243599 RepID=UPI003D95402D